MKLVLGLSITMAFSALLLSGAAFFMAYDLYSQQQEKVQHEMCQKQNIQSYFDCISAD